MTTLQQAAPGPGQPQPHGLRARLRRSAHVWAVYGRVVRLNLKAQAAYKGEFVLGLLFGLVWQGAMVLFAAVLLQRFPGLGGWGQGEVLLIAAMRLLSHGAYVAAFQNLNQVSWFVQDGRIDAFLLRPLPLFRQVLTARVQINGLGDILAGILVFIYALFRLDLDWTPEKALYTAAGILGGTLVEASIQTVLSAAAFRFTGLTTWTQWVDQTISSYGNYPLNILPGIGREALTFVFPVAFIAYLPAAVVTGHTSGTGLPLWLTAGSPVVGLLLFLATKRLWYTALRWYQSPGG